MPKKSQQVRTITTAEARNVSVDMRSFLDSGESLTGTPTVQGSDNLTIASAQVNTADRVVNGQTVSAGGAVQFTVSCSTPGTYPIEILVATDQSQTIEAELTLVVQRTKF